MSKLKPCMNDTCPRYNVDYECHCDYAEYCSNLRLCNIQPAINKYTKLCKKYTPTKPESAWIKEACIIINTLNGIILCNGTKGDKYYVNNISYKFQLKLEKELKE